VRYRLCGSAPAPGKISLKLVNFHSFPHNTHNTVQHRPPIYLKRLDFLVLFVVFHLPCGGSFEQDTGLKALFKTMV
jgi:hypothetical protein